MRTHGEVTMLRTLLLIVRRPFETVVEIVDDKLVSDEGCGGEGADSIEGEPIRYAGALPWRRQPW